MARVAPARPPPVMAMRSFWRDWSPAMVLLILKLCRRICGVGILVDFLTIRRYVLVDDSKKSKDFLLSRWRRN